MKLGKCNITNFSSYKELNFDFNDLGLTLVYGPTGSGKSSLFDAASWILFGVTAKNGSVDDIRSWFDPQGQTHGQLTVELQDGTIVVCRTRGRSSENDLYWVEVSTGETKSGKDITETQKLIEKRLGIDSQLFLSAGYFCEFSPTNTFFLDKPKTQRELFENIADLSLANTISKYITVHKKISKTKLNDIEKEQSFKQGKLFQLEEHLLDIKDKSLEFETHQNDVLLELTSKSTSFETTKASTIAEFETKSISYLKSHESILMTLKEKEEFIAYKLQNESNLCHECKQPGKNYQNLMKDLIIIRVKLEQHNNQLNPFTQRILDAKNSVNNYEELIEKEKLRINPFKSQENKIEKNILKLTIQLNELQKVYDEESLRLLSLNQLYDLSFTFRNELVKQAISNIESNTNKILRDHFDSELKVDFLLEGSDDLTVLIAKNSYPCVYKQLSKGQRQLLKLSFALSVMKAASNKAGIQFNTLFFDEALDGLDSEFKTKAFTVFEELQKSHNSVLIIDHNPEFQNLFENKIKVSQIADISEVTLEN